MERGNFLRLRSNEELNYLQAGVKLQKASITGILHNNPNDRRSLAHQLAATGDSSSIPKVRSVSNQSSSDSSSPSSVKVGKSMRAVVNVALSPLKRKGVKLGPLDEQPPPSSPTMNHPFHRRNSQHRREEASESVFSVEESSSSQQTPPPTAPPLHAAPQITPSSHPRPSTTNAATGSPSRRIFRRSGSLQSGDGSREGDHESPQSHRPWRRPFQKSEPLGSGNSSPKQSASHHPERSYVGPPECHPEETRHARPLSAAPNAHPRAARRMSAGPTFHYVAPSQPQHQQSPREVSDHRRATPARRLIAGSGDVSGEAGGGSSHHRRRPRRMSTGSGVEGEWATSRPAPGAGVADTSVSQVQSYPRGVDPVGDYCTSELRPQPWAPSATDRGPEGQVRQPRRLSAGPGAPSATTMLQQKRFSMGNGDAQPQRHPQQRQPRRMSAGSADPTYFDIGSCRAPDHPSPPSVTPPPPLRQTRRMSTGTADPRGWDPGNRLQQQRPSYSTSEDGPTTSVHFRPPQQRRMSTGTADPQSSFHPGGCGGGGTRRHLDSSGSGDPPAQSEAATPLRQPRRMSAGSADPDYFVDHGNRRRPSSGSGEIRNSHPHPPTRQQQQCRMSTGAADPSVFEPMSRRSSTGSGDSYPTPKLQAPRNPARPQRAEPASPHHDPAPRRSSLGSGGDPHYPRASPTGRPAALTQGRASKGSPEHPGHRFPAGPPTGAGSPNRLVQARRASNGSGERFDSNTPSSHRRVVSPTGAMSPALRHGHGSSVGGNSPRYHQTNNPSQRSASTHGSSGSSSRHRNPRQPAQGSPVRRPSAEANPAQSHPPPSPSSAATAAASSNGRSAQQRSPASSSGRQSVSSRRRANAGDHSEDPNAATSLPCIPASPVKPPTRADADWYPHRTPVRSPRIAASTSTSFDVIESSPSSTNDVRPSAPVRTRTMESTRSSSDAEQQVMDRTERYPLEREAMDVEEYYLDDDGLDYYDEGDEYEGEHSYTDAYQLNHGENDDILVVMDDDDDGEDDHPEHADEGDDTESGTNDQQTVPPHLAAPTSHGPHPTKLYDFARRCQWDLVLRECQEHARDASYVCPKDGTTALHLAVMSRCNPLLRNGELQGYKPASRLVVEALLVACPEAAITRCAGKKYTPLTYACLVTDEGFDMSDAADMVVTILRHAPQSAYVFTDDGFSALDVHIMSYSRLHGHKEEVYSGGRTSTVVVRTLLEEKPALAEARSYRNKIRGPLELLYRCNMDEFKESVEGGPTTRSSAPQKLASVVSQLSDWWAWKWAQLLMKAVSTSDEDAAAGRPFRAVQAAARIVGCPIPILQLAIGMYPEEVEERDPRGELYNLPLHEVASWRCDAELVCGDPFVIRRKARALELLLEEYPVAARTTNNMGETPLQLAIEAGTPWHGGLELLVRACPKALKFPRRLRHRGTDANKTALSVTMHSDLLSVDSEDEDPAAALEGMYPFMVAAVLARVPERQRRDPSFFFEGETAEEHRQNLAKKDLESVRSIYGLLRARPDCLARYATDLQAERRQQEGSRSSPTAGAR